VLGTEVITELHQRLVAIAQEQGVVVGRKTRVDTTVVETNIHYPTDSSLLGDGARVLTRTMKKIEQKAGKLQRKVRDRRRSVKKRVMAIATATRHKRQEGELRRRRQYRELLRLSRQVLNDARRVMREIAELPAKKKAPLRSLGESLTTMAGMVRQIVKQTKKRIFEGLTQMPERSSVCLSRTPRSFAKAKPASRRSSASWCSCRKQRIRSSRTLKSSAHRPSDRELLLPAVEAHHRTLGCIPRPVTADAGFYSQTQEQAVRGRA
jgi:transposase, IS5 family